ncbi:hypothetical protein D9613_000349 [Agrocybe pediades]|uniref:Uncharacterized protein n=1 Tax=Agrocybe pediades TaxID=84607 RepID=A0A8H4R220_9AGAR|nr:hypothetical protein D9613_000349 [Agrocybe pediades]
MPPSKLVNIRLRLVYLVSRYLGLIALGANTFVVSYIQFQASQDECRRWLAFQLVTSTCLLFSLDYHLVCRLYALSKMNSCLYWFLNFAVLVDAIVTLSCGFVAIYEIPFSEPGCLPTESSIGVVALTSVQLATQVLIGICTSYKSIKLYFQNRYMVPIAFLVVRDGFLLFALIAALLSVMLASSLSFGVAQELCYVVYPVYVSVLSISNCRIAMNVAQMRTPSSPSITLRESDTDVVLTTIISEA